LISDFQKYNRKILKKIITKLLQLYPRAARIRDTTGRLPLHLAAEAGRHWDSGMSALVEAAPKAVNTRDIRTNFYPFMLAATAKNCDVDSIYGLLRANPENIRGGIVRTAYEKYLETKNEHLKRKISMLAEVEETISGNDRNMKKRIEKISKIGE